MNANEVSIGIDAAVAIIELAAKIGPGIYAAIQSHGGYSEAQKAALIARVKAAGNYVPRDLDAVPDPKPTHRCKVCGALWRLNPPLSDAEAAGLPANYPLRKATWSLWSKSCGPCCDNVAMGEQIEPFVPDPPPTAPY